MKKMKMPKMNAPTKMPKMGGSMGGMGGGMSDNDADDAMPSAAPAMGGSGTQAFKRGGHVEMSGKGHGHNEMASSTKHGHKSI